VEDIPSLFNNAFQNIAVIAKAVLWFAKTGNCHLNSNVYSEEDFISGEVSFTVTVSTEVDAVGPSRGGPGSSNEEDGADPSRAVDTSGGGVSITEISPLQSTSG
jgi:hypothetical protein